MPNGWRARIANIQPSPRVKPAHGAGPEELRQAAPEGVEFVDVGLDKLPGLDVDVIEHMLAQVEPAAKELARGLSANPLDAIVLTGTPLGFVRGHGSDRELITRIEAIAGLPATTMMTASVEGLRRLGIQRVAVYAPYYPADFNDRLSRFLADSGFEVVCASGGADQPEIAAHAPYSVYRPARALLAKAPRADGLFLAGGGSPTLPIIDALETDSGKPVVSSVQATLWQVLCMVGVREKIPGLGRLLSAF